MNREIKKQILFVLEDDNEVMTRALDSDLDGQNKQMNRALIKRHEEIIAKVNSGKAFSKEELQLIRDANEIHLNDEENVAGHHKGAVRLDRWLDKMLKVRREAVFDNEGKCLNCGSRVSFADVTDTVVFVGDEIVKTYSGDIKNRNCVRCTYPEQYPDYEDYDE